MKVIKPAAAADLTIIQQLAHKIWPLAYGSILSQDQLDYMLDKIYSIPSLKNQLTNLHHEFIIIYDDKPVGFADSCPKEDEPSVCQG